MSLHWLKVQKNCCLSCSGFTAAVSCVSVSQHDCVIPVRVKVALVFNQQLIVVGDKDLYESDLLSAELGVIVVTISYRLSSFGK